MRVVLLLISLLAVSGVCQGQKAAIFIHRQNIVYAGIYNSLNIVAERYPCDNLIVSTTIGTIEKADGDCAYNFRSSEAGTMRVTISVRNQRDTIQLATFPIRVKRIPDPVAMVAGKQGGAIKKNEMAVQLGIAAMLLEFEFDARFEVISYTTHIIRGQQLLFFRNSQDVYFDEETKKQLKDLQPGDHVYFTAIRAKGPDGQIRSLMPLEFLIE